MNSEQYQIPIEDFPAIMEMSAEQTLWPFSDASNIELAIQSFYDDENLHYLGGLGAGEYMRTLFQTSPEALDRYAHAIYIEAYNRHAQYLALRENPNTKLPNTLSLQESFNKMVKHLRPGQSIVAVRIDIDRFKAINGALGYDRGTGVLREVGRKIASVIRADNDVLGHLGEKGEGDVSNPHGDEFVALMVVDTNPVDKPKAKSKPMKKPKKEPETEISRAQSHYAHLARRLDEVRSVDERTKAIKVRLAQEAQTVLDPVADEVNQARVGLNARDLVLGISIGYKIRIEEEDLETLLDEANKELDKEKERRRQAELDGLDPEARKIATVSALGMRSIGLNPDRFADRVLGEGQVPIEEQITMYEEGIASLSRSLEVLRKQVRQD